MAFMETLSKYNDKFPCFPVFVYVIIAIILIIATFIIGALYSGLTAALVGLVYNIIMSIIGIILLSLVCWVGDQYIQWKPLGLGVGTILAFLSILVYILGLLGSNYAQYTILYK